MDNLEKLSDEELQQRLVQFGFPRLPVTGTTRKILIKKLRNHMASEKAKLRRETKFATRYSSDEDSSDMDSRRKSRTTAGASNTRKTTTNASSSSSYSRPTMPPPSTTTIRRATTMSASPTGSRTISPLQEHRLTPESLKLRGDSIYVPPPIVVTDTDEDSDYVGYKTNSSISSRLSASPTIRTSTRTSIATPAATSASGYAYTPDKSLDSSTSSSWFRNRYRSTPQKPIISDHMSPITNGNHSSGSESPYSSDFTQRLLKLRGDTIRDSVYRNYSTQPRVPSDVVCQQSEPQINNISPRAAFSNLINRLGEQYGVKQTLIPCVLLSALIIFFVLVSFMYLTISPDLANTISERNTFYRICGPETSTALALSQRSCIEEGSLAGALEIVKLMAPALQKRIEYHRCKDRTAPFAVGAKEIVRMVQTSRPQINVRQTIRDLHNVEYLIQQNPQWKISPVDVNGNLLTFDQVLALQDTQAYSFAILNPRLPFTCSLFNKLQKFFLYVGVLGLVASIVGGIYFSYKFIIKYQQSKRDTVAQLNDEIINHLMGKAAIDPDDRLVVVNHLRDKLIPLHKRRQMEWAWNETIRFLQQNDSRVQFELGIRNGEDCLMMKWVDTVLANQIGRQSNTIKKWHSPAFDNTNKIINPPTPCLKIRYMFDKHEANNPNLKTIIQDAILEKVGSNCKIYDIQLDKVNCWVYVRCASDKDAGIVHDKINGWWFDKRLVSIKFLRLERFLGRFTNSSSGPMCLRPSNTKNLSMSQCETRDVSAMNGMDDDDDYDDDEVDDDWNQKC